MELQFEEIDFFARPKELFTIDEEESYNVEYPNIIPDQNEQFLNMCLGIQSQVTINCPFQKSVSETEMEISQTTQKEEKKVKTSANHNCQKQTVSALKTIISEKDFQYYFNSTRQFEALKALWEGFLKLKTRITGKISFLTSLFNVDGKQPNKLSEFGFEELLKNFTSQQILEAQENLREITIQKMNQKTISQHIQSRKLLRKQNFYYYLIGFRQALIDRNLKKRMSKKVAQEKAKALQIYDCLA